MSYCHECGEPARPGWLCPIHEISKRAVGDLIRNDLLARCKRARELHVEALTKAWGPDTP